MSRRYTVAVECAQEGCRRRSCFETSSRREERDTRARQDGSWKCEDHRYLDRNLTTSRPEIVTRYRLTRDPETDNSYWVKVGSESLSSGFSYGPGFVARREDWPEGAILEVRATVTLPGEELPMPGPFLCPSCFADVIETGLASPGDLCSDCTYKKEREDAET